MVFNILHCFLRLLGFYWKNFTQLLVAELFQVSASIGRKGMIPELVIFFVVLKLIAPSPLLSTRFLLSLLGNE